MQSIASRRSDRTTKLKIIDLSAILKYFQSLIKNAIQKPYALSLSTEAVHLYLLFRFVTRRILNRFLVKIMDLSPTKVINISTIPLNNEVTKGLVPAQVEHVKESVVEINEELNCVGQSLRAVAAKLSDIKNNVKPGNWRAFLKSGAINCSERFAVDLVSAYTNWLSSSDIGDNLLASLTPRSLALMGSKGVTDKERQKVFEAVEKGERVTEATVRVLVKGNKKKSTARSTQTEGEKVKSLKSKIETYKKIIKNLQDENKQLSRLLSNREKINLSSST